MQAIHSENVQWKSISRGVREAKIYSAIHGSDETRIDLVEVPPGAYIPAHRHSSRTEFITILRSAGAQLQIGDRIFRPVAGQVFHREPEDIMALTNDSHHPFQYSVVRFGFEASDIEWLNADDGIEFQDLKAAHQVTLSAKSDEAKAGEGEDSAAPDSAEADREKVVEASAAEPEKKSKKRKKKKK